MMSRMWRRKGIESGGTTTMCAKKPRSLLTHVFVLAILLVVATNLSWWLILRLDTSRPRAFAEFSASVVNLVRSALTASAPELRPQLLQDWSAQEGIRILPLDAGDVVEPFAEGFHQAVRDEMRKILGTQTQYTLAVNGEAGIWISFALMPGGADDFWLILPRDRAHGMISWHWLGWAALSALLSLVFAWGLAAKVNRPLRRMAQAARLVGRGKTPAPLPEEGTEELALLAQAFNRMSRDLEYNEQERAEILAGISHDLRTPLTRLRLEVDLSLPEGAAYAGMVADIAQMDAIIAQFLDYARGGEEETPTSCDPRALLEEVRAHEEAIQRPLCLQLEDSLPLLPLKIRAVRRALGNLVDNAWKYGAQPVTLLARVEAGFLWLGVADCGAGIPVAARERLKQPFTRHESARSNAGGTGLGLAIVERVARDHGGMLELVQNPEGGGLLAWLKLPLT
jgi:two-component system osmolarity sensor histidine kinase EnvZ